MVQTSRSQKLNTVSRCIAARLLGMTQAIDPRCRLRLEQAMGDLSDTLVVGALTHADQHDALADRHHVAAFDAGAAEILVGVAEPDR